uniref:Uncharacterized protein n=1 Tax=Chromera velia CCMP2878 TaxID=1169474 RepID=A0A0G4IFT6_9ALVE|eukprot:Cvel_14078.t1-p1 / transcript=Cvel_14078.t1 / gene=Cvel_14078 / organism=Chromera_velia_CCMP2878 / gene_product=hypothetical protein / transcript_product=hypothetical protein / location=Cvel_scaffold988:48610-51124(+) / protein_length=352 / sequence_SO=supercontig / SO=protein_coding / is_pseudo=false
MSSISPSATIPGTAPESGATAASSAIRRTGSRLSFAVSRLVQGAFIDRTVSGLVSACGGRCIESSLKIPILLTASGVNRLGRRWQKDFEERKDNDLVFRGTRQKWCKKEGRPQKGDLYSPSRFLSTSAVAQMAVDWGDGGSLLVIRHRTAQPIYPFTPSYAWQLEAQILPGGVFRVEACRESVSLTMAYDGTSKEVDVVFLSEEPWEGTQEGEERALEEFDAEKVMQRVRANLASCFPPYCVGLGGTCASVEEKEAPVVEVSDTLLYTQPFRRHEDTECTSAVEEESRSTVEKQANVESVAESPDPVRSQVALRGSAVGCRRGESGRTGAKEKSPACQILQAVPPSWQIQDL